MAQAQTIARTPKTRIRYVHQRAIRACWSGRLSHGWMDKAVDCDDQLAMIGLLLSFEIKMDLLARPKTKFG